MEGRLRAEMDMEVLHGRETGTSGRNMVFFIQHPLNLLALCFGMPRSCQVKLPDFDVQLHGVGKHLKILLHPGTAPSNAAQPKFALALDISRLDSTL